MPNIDLGNGRADFYHYSVKSWEEWCDKNNFEFVEWTEPIMDVGASNSGMDGYNNFPIIYQREWVLDIIEHNSIDYDQVLIIDADTIVHPNCPNFFKETNHEYSVVTNNSCYEWCTRSIDAWGENVFHDVEKPKMWEYFNTGFIIVNKKHKLFLKKVQNFYLENKELLYDVRTNIKYNGLPIPGVGQTCVNFLVKKYNIKVRHLLSCYNLQDLYKKNLLYIDPQCWWPDNLDNLYNSGWIYHFNSIPPNQMKRDSGYWMERTYKELYG